MKDIGNLNNKDFGVQLDPNNNLKLVEDEDKGQKAYYKNKPKKLVIGLFGINNEKGLIISAHFQVLERGHSKNHTNKDLK